MPWRWLDRLDETRRGHINRNHEIAEHISAPSWQDVRFGHLDDKVWRSELPTVVESGWRWHSGRITFLDTLLHPFLDHRDLFITEPAHNL